LAIRIRSLKPTRPNKPAQPSRRAPLAVHAAPTEITKARCGPKGHSERSNERDRPVQSAKLLGRAVGAEGISLPLSSDLARAAINATSRTRPCGRPVGTVHQITVIHVWNVSWKPLPNDPPECRRLEPASSPTSQFSTLHHATGPRCGKFESGGLGQKCGLGDDFPDLWLRVIAAVVRPWVRFRTSDPPAPAPSG
jgi:hypothetical protein